MVLIAVMPLKVDVQKLTADSNNMRFDDSETMMNL